MYTYGTNCETLLLLAWCSTLDLRAIAYKDRQARPYKYPQMRDWHSPFPEDLLQQEIVEALNCFQDDPYGPVLQPLVEYRLALVDMQEVAWAISLDRLADPTHALFLSDKGANQGKNGDVTETEVFWQGVARHAPLHERCVQLSQTWQDNVRLGAQCLRIFFLQYSHMRLQHQEAPFFVRELLFLSLARVNWHTIAANSLRVEPPPCTCEGSKKNDPAEQVMLFEALLKTVGGDLRQVAELLPDPHRVQHCLSVTSASIHLTLLNTLKRRDDMSEQEAYVLDEQDLQELDTLQHQLELVQQQITGLEGQLERLYPRAESEYFHLGMVGRGGRASAKLNTRKIDTMDSSFEITRKLEPLYRERTRITALIAAITSGQRKQQREKEAIREQRRQEAQTRVREAKVGDSVLDSAFGVVKVVRKNQKSLTIETRSGYREARRFELIKDVVRN